MNLQVAIQKNGAGAFEWGKADCLTFCANVVRDMKGKDYIAEFRGYTGKVGALRLLSRLGGIDAAITRQLGESMPVARLRRGDVALIDVGNGDALGVVCGTTIAYKDNEGVGFLPIHYGKRGWQIDG